MTSVTKTTFARGVGNYLQRTGATAIPTVGLLKQACDIAAEAISVEPALYSVPIEDTYKVASYIQQFADALQERGKFASGGAQPTLDVSDQMAYGDIIQRTVKMAASSIITGAPTPPNNIANSPDSAAVLEAHRPEEYAHVGRGGANIDGVVPAGAVIGRETPHPLAPQGVGGASSNSAVRASKNAHISAQLRKLAEGASTITGDPVMPNTQHVSPNAEGKLDIAQRPEGYAQVGQGGANFDGTPANAVTGMETDHPVQPQHAGVASNSVVDASKNANWRQYFNATAQEVGPYLPETMPSEQKVAAVKQCMSLEPPARAQFLQKIAHQYAPSNTVGSILDSLNTFG